MSDRGRHWVVLSGSCLPPTAREPRVRAIRRGDTGPAVSEIRSILVGLDLLDAASSFDEATSAAVDAFAKAIPGAVDAFDERASAAVDAFDERTSTAVDAFDEAVETAVRAFQQSRGIGVDGIVGPETWQALDGARWKLGARTLFHSIPSALVGEDVRALQERLLEMGYDTGRADAIYGPRTARAVAEFQREVGLSPDGSCGPQTM